MLHRKNKEKKQVFLLKNPGSSLFSEARFFLKEGAVFTDEKDLATKAEKILREYMVIQNPRGENGRSASKRDKGSHSRGAFFPFFLGLSLGVGSGALILFLACRLLEGLS